MSSLQGIPGQPSETYNPAMPSGECACAGNVREALSRQANLEVELPRSALLWVVALAVGEGEPQLDHLQQVHVTTATRAKPISFVGFKSA